MPRIDGCKWAELVYGLAVMFVAVVLFVAHGVAVRVWRSIVDRRDGVTADWDGLRISTTDLIEG